MFFSGGEPWNKGKLDYFCTLGVGHALSRPEVKFLPVIFCTAGWCRGWKQHFCVPGLETCSLNVSVRSEAKETWLVQLSLMRWALFSCFQYWEWEEIRNNFHSRGCRNWKCFIFLPWKITVMHKIAYTCTFKRALAGERGGLLMCVVFWISSFSCCVRLSGCCLHKEGDVSP